MGQETIKTAIDAYVNFSLEGKRVVLPYVLDQSRWRFWRSCGKGSPEEIKREMKNALCNMKYDLNAMSEGEISHFMRQHKLGVECSGFAFNVLNDYVRMTTGQPLTQQLLRYPGIIGHVENLLLQYQRLRRISADTLTSDLNTVPVQTARDVRPGDLIRLSPNDWCGKHVAVIVDNDGRTIKYAHSSRQTVEQGPHYGEIEITEPDSGLEHQNWCEVSKDGQNYGKVALKVENGDGV